MQRLIGPVSIFLLMAGSVYLNKTTDLVICICTTAIISQLFYLEQTIKTLKEN